jgi:hypothetical protein
MAVCSLLEGQSQLDRGSHTLLAGHLLHASASRWAKGSKGADVPSLQFAGGHCLVAQSSWSRHRVNACAFSDGRWRSRARKRGSDDPLDTPAGLGRYGIHELRGEVAYQGLDFRGIDTHRLASIAQTSASLVRDKA